MTAPKLTPAQLVPQLPFHREMHAKLEEVRKVLAPAQTAIERLKSIHDRSLNQTKLDGFDWQYLQQHGFKFSQTAVRSALKWVAAEHEKQKRIVDDIRPEFDRQNATYRTVMADYHKRHPEVVVELEAAEQAERQRVSESLAERRAEA